MIYEWIIIGLCVALGSMFVICTGLMLQTTRMHGEDLDDLQGRVDRLEFMMDSPWSRVPMDASDAPTVHSGRRLPGV